jgi:hypothetical protein
MLSLDVLRLMRRLLDETDQVLSNLTDQELYLAVRDARDLLEVQGIRILSDYAVGTDQASAGYGIVPEPTLEIGTLLAYDAASQLLRQEYRAKLRRGELGVSWSSGLESESTISAEKAYSTAIETLEGTAEGLKLRLRAPFAGTRVQ